MIPNVYYVYMVCVNTPQWKDEWAVNRCEDYVIYSYSQSHVHSVDNKIETKIYATGYGKWPKLYVMFCTFYTSPIYIFRLYKLSSNLSMF